MSNEKMTTDRLWGAVKWFSTSKGYGFLIADGGRGEYYFNEHSCIGTIPADGARVSFEITTQRDGRQRAERVTLVAPAKAAAEPVRP
jgi:cold shock CspA family protein